MPGATGAAGSSAARPGRCRAPPRCRRAEAAGAQQDRRPSPISPTMVDSRPIARRPGVEDHAHPVAEVAGDMGGGGRADVAGAVGAGRRQRTAEGGEQRLRDRMGRHADGNRVETGGDEIGDRRVQTFRQDQRQRARPERFGQPLRRLVEIGEAHGVGNRGAMHDQRIEARAALGEEDRRRRPPRWWRRRRGRRPSPSAWLQVRHGRGRPRRPQCPRLALVADVVNARRICASLCHRVRVPVRGSAAFSPAGDKPRQAAPGEEAWAATTGLPISPSGFALSAGSTAFWRPAPSATSTAAPSMRSSPKRCASPRPNSLPLNAPGDRAGATLGDGRGHDAARLEGDLSALGGRRLERHRRPRRMGRTGPARPRADGRPGNLERRQPGFRRRPDADRRRGPGSRLPTPTTDLQAALPAEDRVRRVDGDDEPDRAAGRLRSRRPDDPRRAGSRRQLPHFRPEDLHHLRRARSDREHRPSRARPAA